MDALGFQPFHLVAHSSGTPYALPYALQDPSKLASIVLASGYSSTKLADKVTSSPRGSLGRLPPYLRQRLEHLMAEGGFESDEFNALYVTFLSTQ
jgi:pimeloyl-ACP methyl ester carboxylesterase